MAQHDDTSDGDGGEGISFETALAALEGVVTRLEKGELSLEESLHAYEEGVRLVHAARSRLDGMQKRLDQLLDDGSTRPLKKKSDQAQPTTTETPES
jgi:exodeoxyribonuclease VII small subunit